MNRAKWYQIHSWVGFKLSILLAFVLITGTLAVFSHEIDWLSNSAKRVSPESVSHTDWGLIYQNARQKLKDKHLLYIEAPTDPWFSVGVAYFEEQKKLHRAFFHPTTGKYLGDGRWYNWQRFFRMTHRHLMMPTIVGISVVGLLGVLLFVSLITSFVIYKGWWKGFFRLPRTTHRKFFWGDLHRLLGVWSMWFVLVISVTGIWYLAELWGLRAEYPSRGEAVTMQALEAKSLPSPDVFSAMIESTNTLYPELTINSIFFPQRKGQVVSIQGQANAILVRDRANMVSFDPISGEKVTLNRGIDLSIHARISEAADPLHFGNFGGLGTKTLYFVFGAALSALSISGVYIYGMRVGKIRRENLKPRRAIWLAASNGLRGWKWFSSLMLAICALLVVYVFSGWFAL